ncbi:HoxN/HupN/NixA family nickel/cobalt transporter [Saccharopolyspora sp. ID03-671]|uniref:HoxN/HupN/NixA family nickel/cobalt transporter n=1 Tax=Saccharopolyspora sp. ID03-671 TaxID=3073066 RepID=UPI003251FCA3
MGETTKTRWATLGPGERRSLFGMAAFIVLLHVVGWGVLLGLVVPNQYALGSQVFGVGLGITAYMLGMRHAFDADHIAAIDNTTRKLMEERRRPLSVGFWFSLGHSSVVFLLCLLISFGVKALARQVEDDGSSLQQLTGVIGTLVSGVFLVLIALLNMVVLVGILGVFRRMRQGEWDEAELERQLNNRGFFNRILGRVFRAITKPWQMYPVGFLFGLGFDTATEISLLVLAGGAAAVSLPWYAILCLPVLFAAGMSLLDAADGVFMSYAYGWALSNPIRKIYYNIVVTGLSVLVAVLIGGIELIGLLAEKLEITTGPLAWIGSIELDSVGYALVALFVVTWLIAIAVWRWGRLEERWSSGLAAKSSTES